MRSVFGISDMSIKCQVMCTRLNPRVVKRGESGGGEVVKWWRFRV
jgi:hypothetical protein